MDWTSVQDLSETDLVHQGLDPCFTFSTVFPLLRPLFWESSSNGRIRLGTFLHQPFAQPHKKLSVRWTFPSVSTCSRVAPESTDISVNES